MARTDLATLQPSQDTTERDLSRLLDRLQKTLLQPSPSKLRTSYERNKVRANLDYARSLLLNLEHSQPAKGTTQKTLATRQVALEDHRAQLRRLQHRLAELNQAAEDGSNREDSSSDSDDASNNEFWDRYAPAIQVSSDGLEATQQHSPGYEENAAAAATLTSALRSRKQGATSPAADTARSSGIASSLPPAQATASPFAPRSPTGTGTLSGNETLSAHHAEEQEKLTASLVTLATALKQSTQSFSDSLAASNPVVDRATAALDKNVSGMGVAEKRMGSLRRMTEGRGWWSRISLYAWIAALWVAAILIVFVLPKFRF